MPQFQWQFSDTIIGGKVWISNYKQHKPMDIINNAYHNLS